MKDFKVGDLLFLENLTGHLIFDGDIKIKTIGIVCKVYLDYGYANISIKKKKRYFVDIFADNKILKEYGIYNSKKESFNFYGLEGDYLGINIWKRLETK